MLAYGAVPEPGAGTEGTHLLVQTADDKGVRCVEGYLACCCPTTNNKDNCQHKT